MNNINNSSDAKISFPPSEKRYIMLTDESGKIKGCFPLKPKNLGKGWIALYQNLAIWIGQQRLTGEQYSVLFILLGKLDFENYLYVSRQEIAKSLHMQPTSVSRAMKKLKELEIIVEGPPIGNVKTYRFNPYIAHKGAERSETISAFEKIFKDRNKTEASSADVLNSELVGDSLVGGN